MKVCRKCKRELEEIHYHKHPNYKDWLNNVCKDCKNKANKNYYKNNKEYWAERFNEVMSDPAKAEDYRSHHREWSKSNPDIVYAQKQKSNAKPEIKEYYRKYIKEWCKKQKTDNPTYKLTKSLRARTTEAIKKGYKSARTEELLGCTFEEARAHLESLFEPGMSWDNYGEWEIDHIKPCALFDLTDPVQQKFCFNYTNLQPLWKIDNRRKSDKLNWKKESA